MSDYKIPAEAIEAMLQRYHDPRHEPDQPEGSHESMEAALREGLEVMGVQVEHGYVDGEHPIRRDPAYRLTTRWLRVEQQQQMIEVPRDLVVRADSMLSLLRHRYTRRDLPVEVTMECDQVIGQLRGSYE